MGVEKSLDSGPPPTADSHSLPPLLNDFVNSLPTLHSFIRTDKMIAMITSLNKMGCLLQNYSNLTFTGRLLLNEN